MKLVFELLVTTSVVPVMMSVQDVVQLETPARRQVMWMLIIMAKLTAGKALLGCSYCACRFPRKRVIVTRYLSWIAEATGLNSEGSTTATLPDFFSCRSQT